MPLWFHPPPVPVSLGAPVLPSPLLYHPPPYPVDIRPVHAYDTVYCACQYSFSKNVSGVCSTAKIPTFEPIPAARGPDLSIPEIPVLRKVHESEWTYEPRRIKDTQSTGDLTKSFKSAKRATNVNITIKHDPLCHCYTQYHEAPVHTSLHGQRWSELYTPTASLQISRAQNAAGQKSERAREERIREEIRAEIRMELEAEKLAARKDLAEKEHEVNRRAESIRERENAWIGRYGNGIVEGRGAIDPQSQMPRIETDIISHDSALNYETVFASAHQIPHSERHEKPKASQPADDLSKEKHLLNSPVILPIFPTAIAVNPPPPMHPPGGQFMPYGEYVDLWDVWNRPVKPPAPTVYTLSSDSSEGGDEIQREVFEDIITQDRFDLPLHAPIHTINNPTLEPAALVAHPEPLYAPPTHQNQTNHIIGRPSLPSPIIGPPAAVTTHPALPADANEITITITRSESASSGRDSSLMGSERESVLTDLRESLLAVADEWRPVGKKVRWSSMPDSVFGDQSTVCGSGDDDGPTGSHDTRFRGSGEIDVVMTY